MTLVREGRVVLPTGVRSGRVVCEGDRIVEVTERDGPPEAGAPWILPGFVDQHVHGGGGHDFADGAEAARAAVAFHAGHGTTSMVASLVSAEHDALCERVAALAPLVVDGTLAGIHLEGPYLHPNHRGAHDPRVLRAPSVAELRELLALGDGAVRMVTLAPELPGAGAAISLLHDAGVVVAIGHTSCDAAGACAAFDAGARVATHLGNGMPPFHHRRGGPVAAALLDGRCVCELIADGHHLADEVLTLWFATAGPERVALVTDAIAAAGCAEGEFRLGSLTVRVRDGVPRILDEGGADGGSLAGSTLTMDAAVRHTLRLGLPIADVARAAATTPARVLGLDDRGRIAEGLRADLVVLDDEWRLREIVRAGVADAPA